MIDCMPLLIFWVFLDSQTSIMFHEHILRLYGDIHLFSQHVQSFMDFILDHNVDHEDIKMRTFAHTLKEDARDWFQGFGKG